MKYETFITNYFTQDKLDFLRKHTKLSFFDKLFIKNKMRKCERNSTEGDKVDYSPAISYEYSLRLEKWNKNYKKKAKKLGARKSEEEFAKGAKFQMYHDIKEEMFKLENKISLDFSRVYSINDQVNDNVVKAVIGPVTEKELEEYIKNSGIDYNYENGFGYYKWSYKFNVITIRVRKENIKHVISIEKIGNNKDIEFVTDDDASYLLYEEMEKAVNVYKENNPTEKKNDHEEARRQRNSRNYEGNLELGRTCLDFSKVSSIEDGIALIRKGVFPAVIKRDINSYNDSEIEILNEYYDFSDIDSCYIYRGKRKDNVSIIIDKNGKILNVVESMFSGESSLDGKIFLENDGIYKTNDGATYILSDLQEQLIQELKEEKHR